MKNVLLIISLFLSFNSFANRQLFDSKWDKVLTRSYFYFTYDFTKYPKLLIGETICFTGKGEDFYDNDNKEYGYQCFYNLYPDTIWTKKPKKNPKINKDYTLMPYYHGIGKYEKDSWTVRDKRYTPKKHIDNFIFMVDSVSDYYSEDYHENCCNVFLTNIQTNEKLFFKISSSIFSGNKISIYSPSLSEKLLHKNSKVYKNISKYVATSKSYKPLTVKEVSYKCDFLYNEYSPYVEIILSSESGYEEKLEYKNGSSDFTYPKYILEDDYNSLVQNEIENEKIYELNTLADLTAVNYEYPFSFRVIWGETNSTDYVHQTIGTYSNSSYIDKKDNLPLDNYIRIGGKQTIKRKDYYIATCYGKCFYIPVNNVTLKDDEKAKLDSLLSSPQETQEKFIEVTKVFELYQYAQDMKNLLSEFESFKKYGLSIVKWKVYDVSEYTDGTGIKFTFYNPTKSMIKYITITFVGYNAVDDPVGRAITKKCIGPIEPDESCEYEFDYAWFTDIVEYAKIRSIKVDYKNGTSKTITNIRNIEWSDELYDFFKNPPLNNLETISIPGQE